MSSTQPTLLLTSHVLQTILIILDPLTTSACHVYLAGQDRHGEWFSQCVDLGLASNCVASRDLGGAKFSHLAPTRPSHPWGSTSVLVDGVTTSARASPFCLGYRDDRSR
ncbi:hypothetical protein BD311DRAFT_763418 [Dichomitus squalens]|uniref:Secreted protein n=1 Tax=Dichomitus squalens TaxID=114155 RepID=A0A4Q9MHC0_9APHY|nr:hypothetical protein BD311DRAFT_763418 [Dichomitus squalens]